MATINNNIYKCVCIYTYIYIVMPHHKVHSHNTIYVYLYEHGSLELYAASRKEEAKKSRKWFIENLIY